MTPSSLPFLRTRGRRAATLTGLGLLGLVGVAPLLLGSPVSAFSGGAATRTWVSGVGDDANPCSRTAPCKTFAGAISKTAAGGEISVLDPGGFGAVTITKSITINGMGVDGSIIVSGTNGITINTASPQDMVRLVGLHLQGGNEPTGTNLGLSGIKVVAVGTLSVDDVTVTGMSGPCLDFQSSTDASLYVSRSTFNNCALGSNGGGVLVAPSSGARAEASIDTTTVSNNRFGVRATANAFVTVHDSTISGSAVNGVVASSTGLPAEIALDSVAVTNNGSAGVSAQGAAATVVLDGSSLSGNTAGISTSSGGVVRSFGNNANSDSGSPTTTSALQ